VPNAGSPKGVMFVPIKLATVTGRLLCGCWGENERTRSVLSAPPSLSAMTMGRGWWLFGLYLGDGGIVVDDRETLHLHGRRHARLRLAR
jgi:hypothetical protein